MIKKKGIQECIRTERATLLLVERYASDRKVADPWFDSQTGNASLCPRERHFALIFHCGQALFPLWWPSLTKDLQTEHEKVLCVGVVRQTQSA